MIATIKTMKMRLESMPMRVGRFGKIVRMGMSLTRTLLMLTSIVVFVAEAKNKMLICLMRMNIMTRDKMLVAAMELLMCLIRMIITRDVMMGAAVMMSMYLHI
jgi:hypothetical protein